MSSSLVGLECPNGPYLAKLNIEQWTGTLGSTDNVTNTATPLVTDTSSPKTLVTSGETKASAYQKTQAKQLIYDNSRPTTKHTLTKHIPKSNRIPWNTIACCYMWTYHLTKIIHLLCWMFTWTEYSKFPRNLSCLGISCFLLYGWSVCVRWLGVHHGWTQIFHSSQVHLSHVRSHLHASHFPGLHWAGLLLPHFDQLQNFSLEFSLFVILSFTSFSIVRYNCWHLFQI